MLCSVYYAPPAWERHEVSVDGGYGLDITRCAIADHYRDLGLSTSANRPSAPRTVVEGFGDIGTENERVITMEWILEGVTLIYAGALTAAVTLIGDHTSTTATVAYTATAGLLIVMAVVSLVTAGRNTFIAYRICAPIFTVSAILLLAAAAT